MPVPKKEIRKSTLKKAKRAARRTTHGRFPDGASSWPVVRAFAPLSVAWSASGFGTSAVIRRSPDGNQYALAAIVLGLADGGFKMAFGKVLPTEVEAMSLLKNFDALPPMEESSLERATLFVYGALALGTAAGYETTPGTEEYLKLFLPPPKGPRLATEALAAVTPPELLRLSQNLAIRSSDADLPDGQGFFVSTLMTLRVDTPAALLAAVKKDSPRFDETEPQGSSRSFDWTREYPPNHWSPLALLGGRQVLGSVQFSPDGTLTAEVKTLSMATRLTVDLQQLSQASLQLEAVLWDDLQEKYEWRRREPDTGSRRSLESSTLS
jgi:hypothetical protein